MRGRLLGGFWALLAAALVLAASPGSASAQAPPRPAPPPPPTQTKPEKKQAPKVWTNDDFAGRPRPVVREAAKPAQEPATAAKAQAGDTASELEDARAMRQRLDTQLQTARKTLEEKNEERRGTDDPLRWEALDLAIKQQQEEIAQTEGMIAELDARIAELEKQAKTRKRRSTRGATKPAASPRP